MVSGTRAAHNVEITAESLQEDLARLEAQKQALERELAAVVAHLGSVQRALSALEVLMLGPAVSNTPAGAVPADAEARAAKSTKAQVDASAESAGVGPGAKSRAEQPKRRSAAAKRTSRAPRAEEEEQQQQQRNYGRLTGQILEYFASVGETDVRARDVAAALGRDSDSGSINAVRSTLDRLVGSSRIRRAGRGLYRAQQS